MRAAGFNERYRQIGMVIEEESVGDEHQVGVRPGIAGQSRVLDRVRIQQRFATEQRESLRLDSM